MKNRYLISWVRRTYPLMDTTSDTDLCELDYHDMDAFANWLVNKKRSILSPREWVKNVMGSSQLEYMDEMGLSTEEALQLMEWYGDYVKNKTKNKPPKLK